MSPVPCAKRYLLRRGALVNCLVVALLLAWMLPAVRASSGPSAQPLTVLFVGNSVTYSNNLPGIVEDVSAGALVADMFVQPGATLSDLLRDRRLERLLKSGKYAVVVAQEQGGNVLCMHGVEERSSAPCQEMRQAHLEIARMARESGARVIYLGTYQPVPVVSKAMVRIERQLSESMDAGYAQISEKARQMGRQRPDLPWFQQDGVHPGIAMTALMAVTVTEAITGQALDVQPLCPRPFTLRLLQEAAVLAQHDPSAVRGTVNCTLDAASMRYLIDFQADSDLDGGQSGRGKGGE